MMYLKFKEGSAPPSHKLAHKKARKQARLMIPSWLISAGRHSCACGPALLYAWLWERGAPPPMDFKRAEPFDPSRARCATPPEPCAQERRPASNYSSRTGLPTDAFQWSAQVVAVRG